MSQQRAKSIVVTDRDGLRGTIDASGAQGLRGGDRQVFVHLEDGRQASVPVDELILQNDGSFTLPFSLTELAGEAEQPPPRAARGPRGRSEDGSVVVPVIAEQLEVQKRKVEAGGVRVRKIVREREEVVDEPLMREEVQVRRVPVNRFVDEPVPVRHVGNTVIVSLLEEVLVVEKRLMLKEELHITKAEVETYKPQRVVLRSEEATIERVGDQAAAGGGDDEVTGPLG